MAKRPEVTPYNPEEYYPYYEDRSANPLLMLAVRALTRAYYRPSIGEDEGAITQIGKLAREGYRVLYSSKHICKFDQNAVGSVLLKRKELRPTADRLLFPAKLAYFQGKYRLFFDNTNSLPITRPEDVDDEQLDLMVPNRHFQDVATKKIIAGDNMLIFYSGSRSKDQESRDTVGEVKKGPAFLAHRVSKSEPVALVSIGLRYPDDGPDDLDWRRPFVYFCAPQVSPFGNKMDVFEELQRNSARALQGVMKMANGH